MRDSGPQAAENEPVRRRPLPSERELMPYVTGFPPGRRWLFFAPHPDDEVLGPGATLAMARTRGVELDVTIVTDGAAQGDAGTREREALAAAAELGLSPPRFWRLSDRALRPDDRELRRAISELILASRPDVVWVTSPVDLHPDHRALALAVQRALRRVTLLGARRRPPEWLAAYEVATPLLPNLLIAADEGWDAKRRAAARYASQLAFRHYDRVMEALGVFRSLTLDGRSRAEAVHLLPVRQVVQRSAGGWAALMGSPVGVRRGGPGGVEVSPPEVRV
jgi:LmbE family N-acetylglucosaminyl deacetylase